MAYTTTTDERTPYGDYHGVGEVDAPATLSHEFTVAEGDWAYGGHLQDQNGYHDYFALGSVASGRYKFTIEAFQWDAETAPTVTGDAKFHGGVVDADDDYLTTEFQAAGGLNRSVTYLDLAEAQDLWFFIGSQWDYTTQYRVKYELVDAFVVRSATSASLGANHRKLTLTGEGDTDGIGNRYANEITGNGGDNVLSGGDGKDRLHGGGGDDFLKGGDGDDRLAGDRGVDILKGGAGADVFLFADRDESGTRSQRDMIVDFTRKVDRIDLQGVDANINRGGDQDFTYIGAKDFSRKAGELRWDDDVLRADLNGDGRSDFEIFLGNEPGKLGSGDFML